MDDSIDIESPLFESKIQRVNNTEELYEQPLTISTRSDSMNNKFWQQFIKKE